MSQAVATDVFVVGAAVAGSVAALLAAQAGLSVFVAEAKAEEDNYKTLCTHFVQPVAVPVMAEIGLDRDLESLGAVRTKAAFHTSAGWIDPPDDYGVEPGGDALWAHNLERSRLDPYFRRRLRETDGITVGLGTVVRGIARMPDGRFQVDAVGPDGPITVSARAVIAADGRRSPVAELMGNKPIHVGENHRACVFGYVRNVDTTRDDRSLFLLGERAMAFLYPLSGRRALLSAYVPKDEYSDWPKEERFERLKAMFAENDRCPDLSGCELETPLYGYSDYPSRVRAAGFGGVFFVGDAAASLDPMSGVGCGFAMSTAALAVEVLKEVLVGTQDPAGDEAADRYRARFEAAILPHATGIMADSLIARSPESTHAVYRRIVADDRMQRLFIGLTGRVVTPAAFQRGFIASATRKRTLEPTA